MGSEQQRKCEKRMVFVAPANIRQGFENLQDAMISSQNIAGCRISKWGTNPRPIKSR
jgi:hypothetical protein